MVLCCSRSQGHGYRSPIPTRPAVIWHSQSSTYEHTGQKKKPAIFSFSKPIIPEWHWRSCCCIFRCSLIRTSLASLSRMESWRSGLHRAHGLEANVKLWQAPKFIHSRELIHLLVASRAPRINLSDQERDYCLQPYVPGLVQIRCLKNGGRTFLRHRDSVYETKSLVVIKFTVFCDISIPTETFWTEFRNNT